MQKSYPLKSYSVNSIHLEITGKCNLKCKYCYNAQFNDECRFSNEMDTDTIKKLINEAKALNCKRFIISGGEPFMRDDIFEIIEACEGLKVEILTNSKLLLLDNRIEQLLRYPYVSMVKISLDGFEENDKVRIGITYNEVLEVIKILKSRGVQIVINTEVTSLNLHEMPRLYEKLKELKVDRWRVDLPFILGRYIEHYEECKLPVFSSFIEVFRDILKDYISCRPSFELELFNIYKSELTPYNAISFDYDTHPCAYRDGSFPIRPNGDMVFCPSMDVPMSNYVKEGSLSAAIDRKFESKFYDLKISDIKECVSCRYINLCNTGCRVDSLYYLDKYDAVDPICCNLMPLIEKEIIPILPEKLKEFYLSLINEGGTLPRQFDIDVLVKNKINAM